MHTVLETVLVPAALPLWPSFYSCGAPMWCLMYEHHMHQYISLYVKLQLYFKYPMRYHMEQYLQHWISENSVITTYNTTCQILLQFTVEQNLQHHWKNSWESGAPKKNLEAMGQAKLTLRFLPTPLPMPSNILPPQKSSSCQDTMA